MHTNTARLALSALLTIVAGVGLGACDTTDDMGVDDIALRSVTITDGWDIYGPTQLPDVNSCDDYWNDRCAGLTPAQCQIAKNRYKCSDSEHGVMIEDGYWTDASAIRWRAVDMEGSVGTDGAEDPFTACEGLADYETCAQLAALAEQLNESLPELTQGSPNGGIGSVFAVKGGVAISPEFALEGSDDLTLGLADALSWSAPALEQQSLEGGYVFEDNVILMVRPNGTLSVSTPKVALVQDLPLEVFGDCGTGGLTLATEQVIEEQPLAL